MSMWLNVVVMPEAAFAKVKADGQLLDGLLFPEDDAAETAAFTALGLAAADSSGCDYRSLAAAGEAMAEIDGDEDDDDDDEDDDGEPDFAPSGELDFDAGFGPAFYIEPKAAALTNEAWQMAANLDDEVAALLERARNQALYVVAVIS